MGYVPHILADTGDIIGAVVFLLIWAIVAIANQMQKWQEKQRKRRIEMEQQSPPALPRNAPQRARAQPQVRRDPTRRIGLGRPVAKRVPVQRQAPPPPPPPKVMAPVETEVLATDEAARSAARMAQEIGDAIDKRPGAQTPPALTARDISRGLDTQTLRRAYILTEVLRPPIALRGPGEQ